jgi:hypothetical protein
MDLIVPVMLLIYDFCFLLVAVVSVARSWLRLKGNLQKMPRFVNNKNQGRGLIPF